PRPPALRPDRSVMSTPTKQLAAYILIVIVFLVGQVQYSALTAKVASQSYQRSFDNCMQLAQNRAVLRQMVISATEPIVVTPNATPELRDAYAQGNARAERFRAESLAQLPDPN